MSLQPATFSIDNASDHKVHLTEKLQKFADAAKDLRCNMEDASVKMLCEMTDTVVLGTASRSV